MRMTNYSKPMIASDETIVTFVARGAKKISLNHSGRENLRHADSNWRGLNAPSAFGINVAIDTAGIRKNHL